ncbi:MAG TPA: MFS transporter [Bryobacteraceae bacterium]|jgi:ACS family hexuronate transporter-like MFS transporter|nr:MFS transporter [Bryobacteraceae bacterium]
MTAHDESSQNRRAAQIAGRMTSRWLPAFSMMLVSTISYIDRNTLALLAPTILRDAHLSNEQYGFIISAFSIAYMVGNPLWGYILDRIGVRRGMTAAVSIWTLASVAHVFAFGFQGFAVARAVLGLGEGATFPGSLRTVVQTLPKELRSRGIAISYSGGSLGALITPIIITPIAALWGWRGAFWATGAVGAMWLILWSLLSRRIDTVRVPGARPTFNDPRVWAFIAAYALGAFPSAFVLYQASIYLTAVFAKSQIQIGKVLWIPPLGWEIGYFFWGWALDRFSGAMRRQFLILMVLSTPLALIPYLSSYGLTLAMMFFAMFITSGFIIGAVAYATRHFSTDHAGFIAGLGAGSWSLVVALVMPGVGKLFDLHRYDAAFLIAALFPIAGCSIWVMLNRNRPLQ